MINQYIKQSDHQGEDSHAYIIIGFNDVVKRNGAFSFLKKNVYQIKCYFPKECWNLAK